MSTTPLPERTLEERLESAGDDFEAGRVSEDDIRQLLRELGEHGVRSSEFSSMQFTLQALSGILAVSRKRDLSREVEDALGTLRVADEGMR